MNITMYEDAGVFLECGAEWDELLNDSAANQIFLTAEWQSAWWQAYHPGELCVLVVRDETGRWMGVAPWFISPDERGLRIIRTVGCVDVTDYLDIVARRGFETAVFDAVAGWLAHNTDRYDEAQLCNIPEASLALAQMPSLAQAQGLTVTVRLQEVCPIVTLPGRFEDYLVGLDKKNRHELRRKLRRAGGMVGWYIVGPEHDLSAELERFFGLMAASSDEKARFLDDPANDAFFRLMVPLMARRGWLQLAFLTVNNTAAATYLNFAYDSRILVYNSGHSGETHAHLSPGIVLLARLIEHAIEEGRTEFDFLRGDEPYKYDMGGRDTNIYQMVISHGGQSGD